MSDQAVTHLPALLSHLAGVPRSRVRKDIAGGKVLVDGKPWAEMDLPHSALPAGGYFEHPYREQVAERMRNGLIPSWPDDLPLN